MRRETREAVLPAFAKINFSLKVLYKRPDNFHEIATVFQTVSLADELRLTVEPGAARSIAVDANVEIEGENLAARAARLVMNELGMDAAVRISIAKRIPMGGGLGGGSSDAAAVLLGLPALMGGNIGLDRLGALGASLGSDVPFFLMGGTCLATGRGELLEPLPDPAGLHGILCEPGLHVSSSQAYRALSRPLEAELTQPARDAILEKFRAFVRSLREGQPPEVWSGNCENDFEPVAFEQHPKIHSNLEAIQRSGACPARMSGSGSSLFGFYASAEAAAAAEAQLEVELSGHVMAIQTVSHPQYERAWQRALSSFADGVHWPPRSRVL